jgi:hypothetical protein
MATPSVRHRPAAAAIDTEEAAIHHPEWPNTVALQILEQARNDALRRRRPRRVLDMLSERIRWRGTKQGTELPLPVTAKSQSWFQKILQSARGQKGKDASSSRLLLSVLYSAALSFVFGEQLFGNTNTLIGSFWMQPLRAMYVPQCLFCLIAKFRRNDDRSC